MKNIINFPRKKNNNEEDAYTLAEALAELDELEEEDPYPDDDESDMKDFRHALTENKIRKLNGLDPNNDIAGEFAKIIANETVK